MEGRRVLRDVHGHRGDRATRRRGAEAGPRPHRRDPQPRRSGAIVRRDRGARRTDADGCQIEAGRQRVLHEERLGVRRPAQQVRRARRADVPAARRLTRRGSEGRAHRAGDGDTARARVEDAGRAARSRRQLPQDVARAARLARAAPAVGAVLRRRRLADSGVDRRRAAAVLPRARLARRHRARGRLAHAAPLACRARRWKRCARSTDTRLGELLGQEYVKRTFPPEAKARAVAIVENLIAEFRQRIQGTAWMSDPTKREALAKLDAFGRKIGYPDQWLDYSKLTIVADDYFTNARAADRWSWRRDWAKVNKPTVRTEWGMTPPTVNAYANSSLNEIVFPAGILQPPFFDPNADDAVNYGAMGAVIGHEMSHLFDDQGRKYDKAGNLRDWWTKEDADRYVAQADRIVKQFDAYTVVDTATHVNGKLTLGENLGDFGGLTVAYYALQHALGNKPRTPIDGFTPEQRFFLGWAQVWRELMRPEFARFLVSSNPHSPGEWRVNGPLSMMPEFQAAWGCKEGDPMVRKAEGRAKIW
ncbi:MAG: hypothetical protein DMD35_22355 [Gemmatimonadetes bacterium]|nr:MAG: hypothetical protein DMD35_22355 [Gemmatimonadota bacterium]